MNGILSFEQEFVRQKPNHVFLLRYMREAIDVSEVRWEDLTTLNLSRIRDYICELVTSNSACTYLAEFKAFLNRYKDEDLIPCKDVTKELKAKRTPSQNIFLTEDEIELIEKYEPASDTERDIKAAFLIECFCGARSSDVKTFTEQNIIDGKLRYVSQKTKVESSVPIHRNLMQYLEYKPTSQHNRAVYGDTIKRICRRCGITSEVKLFYHGQTQTLPKYQLVNSHTARRSFASNLAVRGVPRSVICALMNHNKNENMTARYICVDTDNLDANAMSFFA